MVKFKSKNYFQIPKNYLERILIFNKQIIKAFGKLYFRKNFYNCCFIPVSIIY